MKGIQAGFARAALTSLGLLTALPVASQTQSDVAFPCDRACLTRVVDAYFAGLLANDPARVPLAPGAKITLNDDVVAACTAVLG